MLVTLPLIVITPHDRRSRLHQDGHYSIKLHLKHAAAKAAQQLFCRGSIKSVKGSIKLMMARARMVHGIMSCAGVSFYAFCTRKAW
jgi:hypothetical protein